MKTDRDFQHFPVLLQESLKSFQDNPGTVYVDGTLGGGGHTAEILKLPNLQKLIAIDRDSQMIEKAQKRFESEIASGKLVLVKGNYGDLAEILQKLDLPGADGILVDAGVSSFQLDQAERGFSFSKEGPLDMRMDTGQELTAATIVNQWAPSELERIFFKYGEERFSRKVVGRIVERRAEKSFTTTTDLAHVIERAIPRGAQKNIHPATRVFQAIRIAVNDELGGLERILGSLPGLLCPGGVFAAISFHSLEDKLIKARLKELTTACKCPPDFPVCRCGGVAQGSLPQRKAIIASDEEISANPRSRSAKLRVFQRSK